MLLCCAVQGSARVIRCLQNQRDKLSSVCRSTLMFEEVRFSENIDFQYPMKQACAQEIERFCDVVPHGGGRVIRCLQVRCWGGGTRRHFRSQQSGIA
jgi:Golgi apparatus protein 1